jgi:polysaccharide biosynthesis/export protein
MKSRLGALVIGTVLAATTVSASAQFSTAPGDSSGMSGSGNPFGQGVYGGVPVPGYQTPGFQGSGIQAPGYGYPGTGYGAQSPGCAYQPGSGYLPPGCQPSGFQGPGGTTTSGATTFPPSSSTTPGLLAPVIQAPMPQLPPSVLRRLGTTAVPTNVPGQFQFVPGQAFPGQMQPGQGFPGQMQSGQTVPGQLMPGQPMPGQFMPAQPMPGQFMPGQPMPGQLTPGQFMPGQPMPGQQFTDQFGNPIAPTVPATPLDQAANLLRPSDAGDMPMSSIELGFLGLVSAPGDPIRPLRQFGYPFFRTSVSTFMAVDDSPVGPEYVLGPGDDVTVNVWGQVDGSIMKTVDRSGQIVLPKVGAVRLWGLTYSEADRLIREQISRYFVGFKTNLTLGRLRMIRVNVVGEVAQPGSYNVGSLASLTNALVSAGGPSGTGSLREIRLHRNSHVVGTMDFYDYLLHGNRQNDFRLESGDTIFIPPVGRVAGVVGEVKRPAIYELKGPTKLSELIDLAGGVTPRAYLKRVQIVRAQPSAERAASDVDLTDFYAKNDTNADVMIENGDLVRIFTSDPRIYNTVRVDGAVKYTGDYEIRQGMRLSELLPASAVLPEAYLDRVEIARRNLDRSVQIIPVNLRQAWAGDKSQDLVLAKYDQIAVKVDRHEDTSLRLATIVLNGEFRRPGPYPIAVGETLSSVIRRAGGFTDRAYVKGAVFSRESLKRIESEQLQNFLRLQEQNLLADAGTTVIGGDKEDATERTQALQARKQLLLALSARTMVGRLVIKLDDPDRLDGTSDDVALEDGDALTVGQVPGSVLVIGAVRASTSVTFKDGSGMEYYLNRVGGMTEQADKKEIHIIKADGSAVAGFAKARVVEPGDTVVVPPKQEEKWRVLPTMKDVMATIGSALISFAALAVLF